MSRSYAGLPYRGGVAWTSSADAMDDWESTAWDRLYRRGERVDVE